MGAMTGSYLSGVDNLEAEIVWVPPVGLVLVGLIGLVGLAA